MMNSKLILIALGLSLLASSGWAQSVKTLDSFNLEKDAKAAATPTPGANVRQNCFVNPDQPKCTDAQQSTRSFSLEDVVNLGIVDRLEVEVENEQGEIVRVEDRVEPLPSIDLEILFDYNSATIRSDQMVPLVALARELKELDFNRARLVLMGHTDGVGSAAYNKKLSYLRAQSVSEFLGMAANIPTYRIRTSGMGFDYLRYPGDPEHPGNRRVQILLIE